MVLTKKMTLRVGLTKGLLLLSLLASFTACNEAEFYQKDFLKGAGVDVDGDIPSADDIPLDSPEHPNNQQPTNSDPSGSTNPNDPTDGSDPSDPTDPDYPGTTPTYSSVTETFIQNANAKSKVDIVWVIDDSGSMGDEQESLAYNFDAFITDFMSKDVDFRMAITTTDPTKRVDGKMVCDWHVLNSEHAAVNQQNFFHMFQKCIKVGTKGSGHEKGLNATDRFLHHYHDGQSGNGNNPFLREDAYLIVVIVSDEEDLSSKNVPQYVKRLQAVKATEGMVKIYSIVNTDQTTAQWESKGERYMKASKATNGAIADIHDNFYQILTDFGSNIVNLLDSFSIAKTPFNNDINVLINGVATTEFVYDATANSIKFNQGFVPASGSEIKVTYTIAD
jgi:hypothetical protein